MEAKVIKKELNDNWKIVTVFSLGELFFVECDWKTVGFAESETKYHQNVLTKLIYNRKITIWNKAIYDQRRHVNFLEKEVKTAQFHISFLKQKGEFTFKSELKGFNKELCQLKIEESSAEVEYYKAKKELLVLEDKFIEKLTIQRVEDMKNLTKNEFLLKYWYYLKEYNAN